MEAHLDVLPFQETLNAGMCGPASLKIVLAFYGLDISESGLASISKTDKTLGSTAENLALAARSLGFETEIRTECSFDDLFAWLRKGVPVIVDWFTRGRDDYPEDMLSADGHYSVVCGLDDTHIFLQDPEIGGIRRLRREVFERVWFDFSGEFILPQEIILRQSIAVYQVSKIAQEVPQT